MAGTVVKGRDLMVFKASGEPDAYTYTAFIAAMTHTLSLNTEDIDISSKDSGEWGDSIAGQTTWEITMNCQFVDTDYDEMMGMAISHERFPLLFVKKKNAGDPGAKPTGGWEPDATGGWMGDVEVRSVSVSAPHNGQATYDVTFRGCGPLTKRT